MKNLALVLGALSLASLLLSRPLAASEADAGLGLGGDEPSTFFDFTWVGVGSDEPTVVPGIGMRIENLSDTDITVSVELACHGLINSHSSLDLGTHRISAREGLDLWAPADEMPIQSRRMVSQVRAEISALMSTPDGSFEQEDVSAEIYYRHLQNPQQMRVFSKRGLLDYHGGRIGPPIDCCGPAQCGGITLGRVADPSAPGGYRPVTAWDESLLKRDDQGQVVLRLTGLRVREGRDPQPLPPICDFLGPWVEDSAVSEADEEWTIQDEPLPDVIAEGASEAPEQWWVQMGLAAPPPGWEPPAPLPEASTSKMRFCTTWQSQYVDAGAGEDVFTSTQLQYRVARYARAAVSVLVYIPFLNIYVPYPIWFGNLDGGGCTPFIDVLPETKYLVSQASVIERHEQIGDLFLPRKIYLMPEGQPEFPLDAHPEPDYEWFHTEVQTGLLGPGPYLAQMNLETQWHDWHSNLGPIAGRILHWAGRLNFPICHAMFVRQNGSISETHPTGDVCIWYNPSTGKDRSAWKFATTHEFGHSNAAVTNGPYHSAEYDPVDVYPPTEKCTCDHVYSSSQLHCIQSREYIREAENEGWAQSWSAAVYNYRNEDDSWFAYYKETWKEGISPGSWYIALPPVSVDFTDNAKWMETHCPQGWDDRGVELDWMVFFRRVWAVGDDRFSFDGLSEVWAETTDVEKKWESLLETVDILYPASPKYWHFHDTGSWAGIDH